MQNSAIMAIIEISDIVGAIEGFKASQKDYSKDKYATTIEQIMPIKDLTHQNINSFSEDQVNTLLLLCTALLNQNPTSVQYKTDCCNIMNQLLTPLRDYLNCFNLTLEDARKMSSITKRAFEQGARS